MRNAILNQLKECRPVGFKAAQKAVGQWCIEYEYCCFDFVEVILTQYRFTVFLAVNYGREHPLVPDLSPTTYTPRAGRP